MAQALEGFHAASSLRAPVRFFQDQGLYLSVGVSAAALLWAIGQQVNLSTVLVYGLCLGNLIMPPLHWVRRVYGRVRSPYNWLIFLAAVAILTLPVYAAASVVVWWIAPPAPQPLGHLIRTGWKLPSLMIDIFAVVSVLFTETKEQLERRNLELQLSVEFNAARLEVEEQELKAALEIQQSLLPKNIPQVAGFEVATAWRPARVVGGDYFDVLKLSDTRLAVCIADVVGKGVSAALLMANVQAAVRAFARDSESPASVCSSVNGALCENIRSGKFVTFFYGVLDADRRTFQYCNAGHPSAIVVSAKSVRQLSAEGAVLGVFPSWKYENVTVEIHAGEKLLLFTDGISEAPAADGREFGEEQIAALAKANHSRSASELKSLLLAQATDFCAGNFQDDVTLLVVAVRSAHDSCEFVPVLP
jgi:serine phosphatase RsbU (regulator of sigma subunit)